MAWIDRLIDCVPDLSEAAGGVAMLGGVIAAFAGVFLASPAVWLGGVLLWGAGRVGSAMSEWKQQRHLANAGTPPGEEAPEAAALDAGPEALERDKEAQRQWRAMIACQERPPFGRLH